MFLTRSQLRRMKEIGAVLTKHGLGYLVTGVGLGKHLYCRGREDVCPAQPQERLVQALEELGPTFIKFGQLLSTRSDLLPAEYIEQLTRLQDTAPTLPMSEIRAVIFDELGHYPEEVYESFDEAPIAAASLGQVHSAVLKSGEKVIVKVQRPGIRTIIDADIEILYALAGFLEGRWERARTYGLVDVVDDFAITIREELDYTREAVNTERLDANMTPESGVRVPKVYSDFTTARVLTLEHIDGVKISDVEALDAMGVDKKALADRLVSAFLKQMLIDGFIHADPHPGNIMVTPEHNLALIDAGQIRQLDVEARGGLVRLFLAFEKQDTRQFAEEVVAIGISRGDVDVPTLTRDLEKLLRQYYDLPVASANIGIILAKVMDISARHRIRLPTGLTIVGKVLANIDGINRSLYPEWNFTSAARPYLARAVRNEFEPKGLLTDAYRSLMDVKDLLFRLPEHLNVIIRKAVEGSFRLEVKLKGLEYLGSKFDRGTNRIAFALIVSSIIIGSSIIAVAFNGPRSSIFNLPTLGIIGYLIAMVMGLWLLVSIIRSGTL